MHFQVVEQPMALLSAQKHTRLHRGNWSKNTARVVLEYKGENRWSMQTVQQQEWPPKKGHQRKKEAFRNHQALFVGWYHLLDPHKNKSLYAIQELL